MDLTPETLKKVASIARLNLTDQEIKEFLPQLEEILKAFSKLDNLNTENTKPSFQPLEIKNVTRDDIKEKSLTQAQALKNTTQKKDNYFKGPKAI